MADCENQQAALFQSIDNRVGKAGKVQPTHIFGDPLPDSRIRRQQRQYAVQLIDEAFIQPGLYFLVVRRLFPSPGASRSQKFNLHDRAGGEGPP